MRRLCMFLCTALLVWSPAATALGALSLKIDRVEHPAFGLANLSFDFPSDGRVSLSIGALRIADHRWRRLRLECAGGGFDAAVLRCERGVLRLPGVRESVRVDFALDMVARTGTLELSVAARGRIAIELLADGSARANVSALDLTLLSEWVPGLVSVSPGGRFDGVFNWRPSRDIELSGRLDGGHFGTRDGLQAAENLGVEVSIRLSPGVGGWDWQATLDWQDGAAYLHPLYVEAGISARAHGDFSDGRLNVREAAISLEGVEQLAASAVIDFRAGALVRAAVALANADLALLGPKWVAPLVAPAAGDRLKFAGRVSGAMEFEHGALRALDAVFDEAGFSFAGGDGGPGLAFGPMSGHVPWRENRSTQASLHIGGGRWQKLALGAFDLDARIERRAVRVDRLRIPVLDGALVLDDLSLNDGDDGWVGGGSLVVEPLSMPLLTEAIGLPSMSGVLSASIPGLRVSPGEVALDGAMVVSVFDGYLRATGLRLLEPFGVGSHLFADIEARHIDLAQLTETFSFGSISGFVDADIRALELVRWKPVGFAARIDSSPGHYRRRISQRAVQNISALGGAGAMAAIQRGILGFFDTFGYSRIGLGCELRAGVCEMDGIGKPGADGRFVIVSGGGIPALDVIGYNPRVDWPVLVDRLQRVIAGNTAAEVR